jgi:hypothetical protein
MTRLVDCCSSLDLDRVLYEHGVLTASLEPNDLVDIVVPSFRVDPIAF